MPEATYTRDYSVDIPVDHTKFKTTPASTRNLRLDLQERLASILYGFTAGEVYSGIKLAEIITQGTGNNAAPTGTGNAAGFSVFGKTMTYLTGSAVQTELFGIDKNSNVIQITKDGKLCLDNSRLTNDTYILGRNSGNSANINIIKVNTGGSPEFGVHPVGPDTSHTADTEYVTKGYTDHFQHDHGGLDGLTDHDHALYVRGREDNRKIDYGTDTLPDSTETTIIFHLTWAAVPVVILTSQNTTLSVSNKAFLTTGPTTTLFKCRQNTGSAEVVHWMAIGQAA